MLQPVTAEAIAKLIYGNRFRFVDERTLQNEIEDLFKEHAIPYIREKVLTPKDRIDFLCGSVGVEIKIGGGLNSVQRQLWRYAADERITDLILVTSRSGHKSLPDKITGKPIYVVHLINSIF